MLGAIADTDTLTYLHATACRSAGVPPPIGAQHLQDGMWGIAGPARPPVDAPQAHASDRASEFQQAAVLGNLEVHVRKPIEHLRLRCVSNSRFEPNLERFFRKVRIDVVLSWTIVCVTLDDEQIRIARDLDQRVGPPVSPE